MFVDKHSFQIRIYVLSCAFPVPEIFQYLNFGNTQESNFIILYYLKQWWENEKKN